MAIQNREDTLPSWQIVWTVILLERLKCTELNSLRLQGHGELMAEKDLQHDAFTSFQHWGIPDKE